LQVYRLIAAVPKSLKACSTFILFFALHSKNNMLPFSLLNFKPSSVETRLLSYMSTLFPITKNGKFSGSDGADFFKNTSFQLSNA
jgi:hypothetical protein